jgi:hypothetical protein
MKQENRRVAIVGAGLIGRAWAVIFARAGWNVRLTDPHVPTLAAAPRLIRDELRALARHGLADDPDGDVARVSIAASLEEAVMDVEFVQENGPEKVEEKRTIFAQLDKFAPPDAVLASSTSAITASRFTEKIAGPRPLSGRASRQPTASGAAGRIVRRALDFARDHRPCAAGLSRNRPGACHRQPRDRRVCAQSAAGRIVGRSVPAGRRRQYLGGRPRSHRQGWPRTALVVSRAVRDHRTQCARRHSGFIARAIPASTRNWRHLPRGPKSTKAPMWIG